MVSFGLPNLMVVFITVTLICHVMVTTALSNGDTSASYISVRALDSYGNSVQLSHAKEAAQRYGRSVVVAVVDIDIAHDQNNNNTEKLLDSSSVTLEEEEQHQNVLKGGLPVSLPSSSFLVVVSLGRSPILHPIQLPLMESDSDPSSMLALCFTGVKGDANWLLQQMQKYAADVWERYDTAVMSVPVVSHVVARLLGRFAAQPEQREWQSSLGLPGKHDNEDDQKSSWSRPLGVQTMILSTGKNQGRRQEQPRLLIVEPSGRVLNPPARCSTGRVSLAAMGKESDKIQARLLHLLRGKRQGSKKATTNIFSLSSSSAKDENPMPSWEDRPPTYERCRDALIRVLLEEATNCDINNGSTQHDTGGEFMVESFSSDRGQIERQMFRYQNANTFVAV